MTQLVALTSGLTLLGVRAAGAAPLLDERGRPYHRSGGARSAARLGHARSHHEDIAYQLFKTDDLLKMHAWACILIFQMRLLKHFDKHRASG